MNTQAKTIGLRSLGFLAAALWMGMATAARSAESGIHGWVLGQDQDGKFVGLVPQANITITSQPSGGGEVVAETASDANGYYRIALSPGQYYYRLQAAGYRDERAGRGFRIQQTDGYEVYHFALTRGRTVPEQPVPGDVVVPVEPLGRLSGLVYEQIPGGLAGIPGAVITLRQAGTLRTRRVVTRGPGVDGTLAGTYDILLGAGTWWPSVIAAGYEPYVERTTPIEIAGGLATTRDFELQRRVPGPDLDQGIFGTVTLWEAIRPAPDAALRFLARPANRLAAEQELGRWRYRAQPPQATGGYDQPLFPGAYRVEAGAPGYRSADRRAFVWPRLRSRVDLVLRPLEDNENEDGTFNVTVAVVTTAGEPVDGGVAEVMGDVIQVAVSDGDGLAGFRCAPGEWDVFARKPGLSQMAPVVMRVGVGEENGATVVMAGGGPPVKPLSVVVVVTDAAMSPIEAADILVRKQTAPAASAQRDRTDKNGLAGFEVDKQGGYTAAARKAGYIAHGKNFDVAGDVTTVHLILDDAQSGGPVLTTQPAQPTQCQAVVTTCPAVATVCTRVPTQCPVLLTHCPGGFTRCPRERTKCPSLPTNCLPGATSCPIVETVCNKDATRCPAVTTLCPPNRTQCPVKSTSCPPNCSTSVPLLPTKCVAVITACRPAVSVCPLQPTTCLGSPTKCPKQDTKCPAVDTKCPPHGMVTKLPVATQCLITTTVCPVKPTNCPTVDTKCPPCPTSSPSLPTTCPATTKCPVAITACPERSTNCPRCPTSGPSLPTVCPAKTMCPVKPTVCPPEKTVCPIQPTKCPDCELPPSPEPPTKRPIALTKCPVVQTRCPQKSTECPSCGDDETRRPVVLTRCPTVQTRCPQVRTSCPACGSVQTRQPVVRTKCPQVRTICPRCSGTPRRGTLGRSASGVEPDVQPTLAAGQLPTFGTRLPSAKR